VPILDILILGGRAGTVAAVNLGGIANMTVLPPSREPYAYDLGPANALIDTEVLRLTGGREGYDKGGGYAMQGRVDLGLLTALLAEPYDAMSHPTSTGKEHVHDGFGAPAERDGQGHVWTITCANVRASTIWSSSRPSRPDRPGGGGELQRCGADEAIASGSGVANPNLMRRLATAAPEVRFSTTDELGAPSDVREAIAFALVGYLTAHSPPTGCLATSPRAPEHPGHGSSGRSPQAPWPSGPVSQSRSGHS